MDINKEEELLPILRKRFGKRIKPEIESVKMIQSSTEVYLEYSINTDPENIYRVDINFIASPRAGNEKVISVPDFNPDNDLNQNIHLFLSETDDYTIILAIDQIFTPDGIEKIIAESVDN